MAKAKTLRVLRIPAVGAPTIETIPHTLAALQSAVGGYVEQFPVTLPGAVGLCDDEFLCHGQGFNRHATTLRKPGVADLYGDILICGDGDGCFASLTDEQVHMAKMFFEVFFQIKVQEK